MFLFYNLLKIGEMLQLNKLTDIDIKPSNLIVTRHPEFDNIKILKLANLEIIKI